MAMTHEVLAHKRLNDRGVEPCVQLAAEHCCRNVEAASDLALGQTVHVLRKVVSQFPAFARGRGAALSRKGVGGDYTKVKK